MMMRIRQGLERTVRQSHTVEWHSAVGLCMAPGHGKRGVERMIPRYDRDGPYVDIEVANSVVIETNGWMHDRLWLVPLSCAQSIVGLRPAVSSE